MSSHQSEASSCFALETLVREPVIVLPKLILEKLTLKQEIERRVKSILRIPVTSTSPVTVTQLSVGFSITNITQENIFLSLFNTYRPQVLTSDNKMLDAGYSAIRRPKQFADSIHKVVPGETQTVFPDLQIVQRTNSLFLLMNERFGTAWDIDDLEIGNYQIRFIYENYQDELMVFDPNNRRSFQMNNIWVGRFSTPYREIKIIRES